MSEELIEKIRNLTAKTQRLPLERVTLDSTFEELGMDSMDGVNLLFAVEGEFDINIPDDQAREIRNVYQMVEGVEALLKAKACTGSQSQASA
jgi:acyl carrier protein